jgi:hypothetical protein
MVLGFDAQLRNFGGTDAMRPTSHALVSAILIAVSASQLNAAESDSRWWPFGKRDETKVAQPPAIAAPSPAPLQTQRGYSALNPAQPPASQAPLAQAQPATGAATEGAAKENWMLSSPKRKISWPRLTKPEMPKTGPFAQKTEPDAARNSWVEKSPAEPKTSPLQPIRNGAQRVAKNTKAAWSKTVDAITPGDPAPQPAPRSDSSRIARTDTKPSMWQRMFGEKENVRPPQTVPEWMAQDRVDRR